MSLTEYKRKRSLNKTPEPEGGRPSSARLAFVVQKHHASHLHYDFRLEIRGALKSWAVPKGPSIDPKDKRLAMLVEDHPFDYKDFEGVIPKGNYGAGSVIVWDQGWYEPAVKVKGKKAQEHELIKQFYAGSIHIILHGKKLKGSFTLNKAAGRGDNAWLLHKENDKSAKTADISKKDRSVVSGKTVEEIAGDKNAKKWESNRAAGVGKTKVNKLIREGKKSAMPARIRPMLSTLSEGVTNDDSYLYEVKWDGYRINAFVKKRKVRLDSRGGLNYTERYPLIVDALKALKADVVLDGEMVVFDEDEKPNFNRVQLYNGHKNPISYFVFDILYCNGYDLKKLSLMKRKTILKELVEGNDLIKFSESFDDGEGLYELMMQKQWEGIIAKKKESEYIESDRSYNWLKFPVKKKDEFVIGGWAESDKARSFRSILFGAYRNGKLTWLGRSGGGFKEKEMPGLLKQLKKYETDKSPFVNKVLDTKGAVIHWVKPRLVAWFEYSEMTESGRIRKPATWKGFREDKNPKDVLIPLVKKLNETTVNEIAEVVPAAPKQPKKKTAGKQKPVYLNKDSGWQKVDEEQKGAVWQEFEMQHCTVSIHNPERELWEGVPKGKLLIYYNEMADHILPYLKDRPQSLNLKLTHAGGPRTFIKDMENRQPPCAHIFTDKRRVKKEGKRTQIDYLVCNNLETLIYLIDLGCVDVNTWASRTHEIEQPDYLWLDLDPTIEKGLKGKALYNAEKKGFEKAIQVAMAAQKVLQKHKLIGFIKTSGKTGLHIYIPCSGFTFGEARRISYKIADEVHRLLPKISTREESTDLRGDKVYIDAGQNDYADTLAAPYSIRPYHEALVSTPLEWEEVKKGLDRYNFTMETIQERLEKKGDLWKKLGDEKLIITNNKSLLKL